MIEYDIIIIGAGFSGLTAANYLSKNNKSASILLIDTGNDFLDRECNYENEGVCKFCNPCNLMAGFGGCFKFGDEAKISKYPNGKRLLNFATNEKKLLEITNEIDKEIFKGLKYNNTKNSFSNISLNSYPIAILGKKKGEKILYELSKKIKGRKNIKLLLNTNIEKIVYHSEELSRIVLISGAQRFTTNQLVVAAGRQGKDWFKCTVDELNINYKQPNPMVGIRFEMDKNLLKSPGICHPDFKAKKAYNNQKVKTFCFCGGKSGGILKALRYERCTLLDGHIRTKRQNKLGNFALLHSVNYSKLQEIKNLYLEELNGQVHIQRYVCFKNNTMDSERLNSSLKNVKNGNVAKIFPEDLRKNICDFFEMLFEKFNNEAGSKYKLDDINIIGLEIENDWYEMELDSDMQSSLKGIYVIGDAAGVAQGILHSAITGYIVAQAINTKMKNENNSP